MNHHCYFLIPLTLKTSFDLHFKHKNYLLQSRAFLNTKSEHEFQFAT
jgi:hypothetical protein